ncbi:glutathione S-transferase F11-like [Phragmites australis]|uniref:glutathione S-transferase F11-like n=1 Tax=Phragmites australis TaxID=29695 RepID=UPI002D7660B4|nr:glutathione S-transferase F11-like [Phragmites australis]
MSTRIRTWIQTRTRVPISPHSSTSPTQPSFPRETGQSYIARWAFAYFSFVMILKICGPKVRLVTRTIPRVRSCFLKLQPFGHVPAFKDHLTTVFGSRANCRYICDQYAERGNQILLGKKEDGAVGRAAIEQWIEAEGQSFNPPSLAIIFQLAFVPMMGRATDMAMVEQNEVKLAKVLDVYEQRLGESQYFAGDEFSLADLVHLPNAHFLVNRTNKAGLITERKNLARWWDDVSARPAWKKVVELQNQPKTS